MFPYAKLTPNNADVNVIDKDSGTRFLWAIKNMTMDIENTINTKY